MARYSGKVGYGHTVQKPGSIHVKEITEKSYFGDIVRESRRLGNGEKVNDDISVGNSISIVADAYAFDNYFAILYAEWNGARWKVTNVEVRRPRLILTLGGVYNGPKAPAG